MDEIDKNGGGREFKKEEARYCYDNAVNESPWGAVKTEFPFERLTGEMEKDEGEFFEYIEIEYNGCRIHSTLGMSPRQFESVNREKFAQLNVHS